MLKFELRHTESLAGECPPVAIGGKRCSAGEPTRSGNDLRKFRQFRADYSPRDARAGPVLMRRLYDRRIVETPGFQVKVLRMPR